LAVLAEVRKLNPQIIAIIITGHGTIETDVEAIKDGAFEFIAKLSTPDEILKIIEKSLTCLKNISCQRTDFAPFARFEKNGIGSTKANKRQFAVVGGNLIKENCHQKFLIIKNEVCSFLFRFRHLRNKICDQKYMLQNVSFTSSKTIAKRNREN